MCILIRNDAFLKMGTPCYGLDINATSTILMLKCIQIS